MIEDQIKESFPLDGEVLYMLMFVDDLVLVASNPEALQNFLNEIHNYLKDFSLSSQE